MKQLDAMKQRVENAHNEFEAWIMEEVGCDEMTARKVMALYLKNKMAKMNVAMGRIDVKHGAYLEPDVLQRAVERVAVA